MRKLAQRTIGLTYVTRAGICPKQGEYSDKEPFAIDGHGLIGTGIAFPCGAIIAVSFSARDTGLQLRRNLWRAAKHFGRYGGHSEDRAFGVDEVGFLGRLIARWSVNLAPEQRRCPSDLSTGSILIYPVKFSERVSGRDTAST